MGDKVRSEIRANITLSYASTHDSILELKLETGEVKQMRGINAGLSVIEEYLRVRVRVGTNVQKERLSVHKSVSCVSAL